MRKLKRRGVFPVIAVLALVIIGVAGGVFVYKFVNPFISRLQSQTDISDILTIEGEKVMGTIYDQIYKKADLEIAMHGNDALAVDTDVMVGIDKRDGVKNYSF